MHNNDELNYWINLFDEKVLVCNDFLESYFHCTPMLFCVFDCVLFLPSSESITCIWIALVLLYLTFEICDLVYITEMAILWRNYHCTSSFKECNSCCILLTCFHFITLKDFHPNHWFYFTPLLQIVVFDYIMYGFILSVYIT